MIVSRDTAALDASGATRATVESVLENGSDAVLAPLFWFALAGAPGVLLYRLANTLDARWGYRSARYLHFGRVAARLDDALNWLPARLCALAYGLAGNLRAAIRCWQQQAPQAASPNGGPVMAAGAGALGILLGGPSFYHGREEWRPILGCGREAQPADIERALGLLWRAIALWVVTLALVEWLLWFT
jgi:adenosylcobinamide-phosphate synthase